MASGQALYLLYVFSTSAVCLGYGATIVDAVKPHRCEDLLCAEPPLGCIAHAFKNEFNCPIKCSYSCGAPWCLPRTCAEHCPGDYAKDKMGCLTCDCKPSCEQKRCWVDCPFGYLRDKTGCRTCACAFSNTLPPVLLTSTTSTLQQKPSENEAVSTRKGTQWSSSAPKATTTTPKSLYCILSSETTTSVST
ncbi:cysteine-rich motor neuron 1 protein-like [Biomphalaria glabrata]|uniref:Cysteine-rich motor neuron 1 protein-like n=1 Tax=Biomphalaria glabrata TaxID=6526 RepID=A0A9U8EJ88_BIOGL|nr:cysteine-rich motor neuron 1 protein-like [Biomphalaria glabrata]XP_055888798.1 cysteine-rich motor neuron 1 protein-like [Biomphalaria glabrata]